MKRTGRNGYREAGSQRWSQAQRRTLPQLKTRGNDAGDEHHGVLRAKPFGGETLPRPLHRRIEESRACTGGSSRGIVHRLRQLRHRLRDELRGDESAMHDRGTKRAMTRDHPAADRRTQSTIRFSGSKNSRTQGPTVGARLDQNSMTVRTLTTKLHSDAHQPRRSVEDEVEDDDDDDFTPVCARTRADPGPVGT